MHFVCLVFYDRPLLMFNTLNIPKMTTLKLSLSSSLVYKNENWCYVQTEF